MIYSGPLGASWTEFEYEVSYENAEACGCSPLPHTVQKAQGTVSISLGCDSTRWTQT